MGKPNFIKNAQSINGYDEHRKLLESCISRLKRYTSYKWTGQKESLGGIYWRLTKVLAFLEPMLRDDERELMKDDHISRNGFDGAFDLLSEVEPGFLINCSVGRDYWRIRCVFFFVESKLKEIDGEESAKKTIRLHGSSVTRVSVNSEKMQTFAVIGAMATTGGDAEEAARLLGVTVEFINERF